MDVTNGKYIRLQKSDPNELKLLEYLKKTGNSEQVVSFDDVGNDAMITLKDPNYTPTADEILFQEFEL